MLARFENGDAAVVEKAMGKGRLVVMTSGWQPVDSQLARSSKFVPLMAALLEGQDVAAVGRDQLRRSRPRAAAGDGESGCGSDRPQTGRGHRQNRAQRRVLCRDGSARCVHSRHAGRRAVVCREPRSDGEQDGALCMWKRWSSSAAGWRATSPRMSTKSSFGRCIAQSSKIARSSGAG